jgi:hypothetical protein
VTNMGNANGITFDLSDDNQFRQYCVQQFTLLGERTAGFAELKAKIPVIEQEVKDLRDDAKTQSWRQWGHSLAILAITTAKNIALHGRV